MDEANQYHIFHDKKVNIKKVNIKRTRTHAKNLHLKEKSSVSISKTMLCIR
jgi:hypothetical protein